MCQKPRVTGDWVTVSSDCHLVVGTGHCCCYTDSIASTGNRAALL
jgi:hypothetical protein